MRLDWNLNVGTLLSIIGAMLLFLWRFHLSTVNRLEQAIEQLEDRLRQRVHDIANESHALQMELYERIHQIDIRLTRIEDHREASSK